MPEGLLAALMGAATGCIIVYFLYPPIVRLAYEPRFRELREEVLHRYATFSGCLSARVDLLRRVEEANATYSKAEREYAYPQ